MDWDVVGDWIERELRDLGDWLVGLTVGLLQTLVIVLLARMLVRWARRRIQRPRLTARLGVNLTTLLANVVAMVIYVVAFSLVLAVFGASLSALVAYLSVTTLAVGLALQETLRNTIAGIYLLLERPFNIGDRVTVRDINGRLENIELRTTAIRSETGDLVLVPNSIVFTEIVTNRTATRATRTRLQVTKLPLAAVEAQRQVRDLVNELGDLRRPDPVVEAVARMEAGTTVTISVWHDPDVPVRTRLIGALQDAFPESEVSSAPDIAS